MTLNCSLPVSLSREHVLNVPVFFSLTQDGLTSRSFGHAGACNCRVTSNGNMKRLLHLDQGIWVPLMHVTLHVTQLPSTRTGLEALDKASAAATTKAGIGTKLNYFDDFILT